MQPSPVRGANGVAKPEPRFLSDAALANAERLFGSIKSQSGADLSEKIKDLIRLAREQGYLTFDDVHEALPETLISAEGLAEVYRTLGNLDIEIIDQSEVDRAQQPQPEEADEEARLDALDDPLRMYLSQMGKVPLLTREGEVAICKRIEDAESEVKRILYGLGFAAVYAASGLLYVHAYRLRDALELNELERFDTRYQIFRLLSLVAVGLVAASLAMVIRLAEARQARGLSMSDLVQEGSLGFLDAVNTFGQAEAPDFGTFAESRVGEQMDAAIAAETAAVRDAEQLVAAATDYERTEVLLHRLLQRSATEAEIAEKLEWSVERTRYVAQVVAEARRRHDEELLAFIDPEAIDPEAFAVPSAAGNTR